MPQINVCGDRGGSAHRIRYGLIFCFSASEKQVIWLEILVKEQMHLESGAILLEYMHAFVSYKTGSGGHIGNLIERTASVLWN